MKPVDYVVFALVVVIGSVITSPILLFLMTGSRPDMDTKKLMASVVTSLVAIVSIYVGSRLKHKDDE